MSVDSTMQNFQIDIFPTPIERRVKYDPSSKSLKTLIDGSDYVRGDVLVYESPTLNRALRNVTTLTPIDEGMDLAAIISEFETSITKHKKIWESIPTIEDYFDLDTINDVDEVESAFYHASEEFGW